MTFLLITACLVLASSTNPAEDETRALFAKVVPELLEANDIPGAAVALVRGGEVAWAEGFGMADESASKPVTADTIFNVGSISKVVTAWGVMRLVEAEELDLDEPVGSHLTRWKFPESEFDSAGVTARRLMSHTAGLSMPSIPGFEVPKPLPTLEEILSGYYYGCVYAKDESPVELVSRPGSEWRYSGGGTVMLQLLIEEITKESFADYMAAKVLGPLGMEGSRYGWTDLLAERAAVPYSGSGRALPTYRFTGTAGAGLYASANDLARFLAAGLSGPAGSEPGRGVLKKETVARMQERVPLTDGTASQCGLGYFVREDDEQPFKSVSHGGSNFGWQAFVIGVPKRGSGLVILTNSDNGGSIFHELACLWSKSELDFTPSDCE
ncbi:MAG: serine hydrolase [Planctomycetota bacterium]|nr:serine hydrolase [Planctomycetota bacterium]